MLRRRKIRTRSLTIVALGVILVVALFAAGEFPQEPLRRLVDRRLRAALGAGSRIERLHVVPGTLSAEIHGLVVDQPTYRLELPQARVRAGLQMLLSGRLSLRALEARGGRLTLRASSDRPPMRSPLPELRIDDLQLTDGQLRYHDPELGGDIALTGISARGSVGSGALDARVGRATWERPTPLAVAPIEARLRVSPDLGLEVERLEAKTAESRLSASGRVGPIFEPDLDLRLELAADLRELASLAASPAELSGRVNARADVQGPLASARVAVLLSGDRLALGSWPMERLEARAAWTQGAPARFESTASLWLLGGRVEAHATGEGTRLQARVRARDLRPERLPAEWIGAGLHVAGGLGGQAQVRGDVRSNLELQARVTGQGNVGRTRQDGVLEVAGSWSPRQSSVDLVWAAGVRASSQEPAGTMPVRQTQVRLEGRARGPVPPRVEGRVEGDAQLQPPQGAPERMTLRGAFHTEAGGALHAELSADGREARVRGVVDASGSEIRRLDVRAEGLRLETLWPHAAGRVDLTLSAAGRTDRLGGRAQASASDVVWHGATLGELRLDAEAEAGVVQAAVSAPALGVRGEAKLTASRELDARIAIEDANLSRLAPLAGGGVSGTLSAGVHIRADASRLEQAEATAEIRHADVARGRLKARLEQPASIAVRDRRVRVAAPGLSVNGSRVSVNGELPLQPGDAIDLRIEAGERLAALPLSEALQAAAAVSGAASVTGTVEHPRVDGRLALADLVVSPADGAAALLTTPRLELLLEGDRVVLPEIELQLAGGRARVSGELPISLERSRVRAPAAAEAHLEASWSDLSAAALLAAAGLGPSTRFEARLGGEASLSGPLASLERARGRLRLEAAATRVGDLALDVSPVRLELESGVATLQPLSVGSGDARLELVGRADLARGTVRASSSGRLDLRALDPLLTDGSVSGAARLDLELSGPLRSPGGEGCLTVEDATLRMAALPQALRELQGAVCLAGDKLEVRSFSAELGGGRLELAGSARLRGAALDDVRIDGRAREVSLRYPRDFKSRVSADLLLTGRSGQLLLGGQLRAERGLYDTDIDLIREAFRDTQEPAAAQAPEWMRAVALDLELTSENPILIRNNLAQLAARGRLQVRGDMQSPAVFGRLSLREGGKIFLQTRQFVVESGSLAFSGSLDPEVALRARALVRQLGTEDVEVTVVAEGPLMAPRITLSSDPPYSEKEIASLIATGRRRVAAENAARVAGEQAAAMLAGRYTRDIAEGFESLGFDQVEIQPELLAREADPSARFTFGKQVTPQVRLIYSTGLTDAEERYFEAQYRMRVGRVITFKLQRGEDGIYSYGAGQQLRFGGGRRPRRARTETTTRLSELRFEGDAPVPEARLREWVDADVGSDVTYWDLQESAEALEGRLRRQGFVEALVGVRLEQGVASFEVRSGARYSTAVTGWSQAPDLTSALENVLSEEEAVEKGRQTLLGAAHERGYYRAQVETRVEKDGDGRTLVFDVELGARIDAVDVSFPGAASLSEGRLLEAAGGRAALLQEPAAARERVQEAYRSAHFLQVRVSAPRITESEDAARVSVVVAVVEGTRAPVTSVVFPGSSLDAATLRDLASPVRIGQAYDQAAVATAVDRMRDRYLKLGYTRARIHTRVVPVAGGLELEIRTIEGERSTVGRVVVQGLRRTRESLVQKQVQLGPGDPLDPRELAELERKLLELDVFSRVAVTADDAEPATVKVEVQESAPYTVAYDLRFSAEERATALIDGEVGNLWGRGLKLGARYRAGADLREARGSFHVPALGRSGDLTATVFYTEEDFRLVSEGPFGGGPRSDTQIERGFQLQRSIQPRPGWDLLYGYRFKRVSTELAPLHQNVAAVDLSLVREGRDRPLDPRRGSFLSLTLDLGPRVLGSSFAFSRVFAQAFLVRELNPWLVWAQGYRLGLARGLELERARQLELYGRASELFRAGGANSIRGFATDSVGPPGPVSGISLGGEALVVLNQELRYHHVSGLGAAAFYDAGNVFATPDDLSLRLRHSLGAGLRWDSPVGLLRLDVGFPLDRRRGEPRWRWFFSLGQAF